MTQEGIFIIMVSQEAEPIESVRIAYSEDGSFKGCLLGLSYVIRKDLL